MHGGDMCRQGWKSEMFSLQPRAPRDRQPTMQLLVPYSLTQHVCPPEPCEKSRRQAPSQENDLQRMYGRSMWRALETQQEDGTYNQRGTWAGLNRHGQGARHATCHGGDRRHLPLWCKYVRSMLDIVKIFQPTCLDDKAKKALFHRKDSPWHSDLIHRGWAISYKKMCQLHAACCVLFTYYYVTV